MKHTKNILKSLLITVMALSLLSVSCSKDEGGSKPTNPTTVTISAADLTSTLKGIEGTTKVDFSTMSTPQNGEANIGNADAKFNDVKNELTTIFTGLASNNLVALTTDIENAVQPSDSSALVVTLTMTAKSGFQFASDITTTGYGKGSKDGEITLKINITPSSAWN